jgi:predicted nicotinamide N-methyase
MKNAKYNKVVSSLNWRHTYTNAEIYPIELEDGRVLEFKQVANGETTGVGTGASLWPAAHVLSKYMEKRFLADETYLKGKRVCDIGSGTGCTGIVAAAFGAEATLTDMECVFFLMEENKARVLKAHQTSIKEEDILCKIYDWGESIDHLKAPFDIVIVSDCVLPKLYPIEPLVEAMAAVMGPDSVAIYSYEHRPYPYFDPRHEFERLCIKHGLKKTLVPLSEHHPTYSCEDIEIWEVRCMTDGEREAAQSSESMRALQHKSVLQMRSWGSLPEVTAEMDGTPFTIQQKIDGSIGCILWPSSVVMSRYVLSPNALTEKISSGTGRRPLALDLGMHESTP